MKLPLVLQTVALADLITVETAYPALGESLAASRLRVIDLRSPQEYADGHIPGALHGDAALLNRVEPPTGGLLPEPAELNRFLHHCGIRPGDHIVAYDAGMHTIAARLIWVLDAYGFGASSWLNGGFRVWCDEKHPVSRDPYVPEPGTLTLNPIGGNVVSVDQLIQAIGYEPAHSLTVGHPTEQSDADELAQRVSSEQTDVVEDSQVHEPLNDDPFVIDARSLAEYQGVDVRSTFGGHVPTARHLEWTSLFNSEGRLHDDDTLAALFNGLVGSIEEPVVVYCQTHQRSAVTYLALKHLGYTNVSAIDGAWSSWGNREDTPKA